MSELQDRIKAEEQRLAKNSMDRFARIEEIIDAQFLLAKAGGAENLQVYGELSYVIQYEPKPN